MHLKIHASSKVSHDIGIGAFDQHHLEHCQGQTNRLTSRDAGPVAQRDSFVNMTWSTYANRGRMME